MWRAPLLLLLASFLLVACGSTKEDKKLTVHSSPPSLLSAEEVALVIEDWPLQRQLLVESLIKKYGPPDESTANSLIWHGRGPWVRTVVNGKVTEEPLTQTAALTVPLEKRGELGLFDQDVLVDEGRGSVTVAGRREEINFFTLDLTREILRGELSPMEARRRAMDVEAEEALSGH